MIVVQISGGIGNQLFQYCYALHLKNLNPNKKVCIENSFYQCQPSLLDQRRYELGDFENLGIELVNVDFINKMRSIKSKIIKKIWYLFMIVFKPSKAYFIISNNSGIINAAISKLFKNNYLTGDWQNKDFDYKFYLNAVSNLKLRPEKEAELINQNLLGQIKTRNSVAVCIRRSDYVRIGVQSDKKYFEDAINYFNSKFNNSFFWFFSDDIDWCKNQFSHVSNTHFINKNNEMPFEDLLLISQCKHAIISKSTFAWWGSMMIKNPEKLVVVDGNWKLDGFNGMCKLSKLIN